ncbi:filamentous hemagglutinin N-terminal domain-containing protein [Baaleninema sp.]|uniref:two-partner secretion domain-containing protein n=1 Tax=Baaleninema sp. TaxID=3101197 RepID=UPI003CFE4BE2
MSFSYGLAALSSLVIFPIVGATQVVGQIVPDDTLSVPSNVTVEQEIYTLNGGMEAGNNLFHSFREFSLPTGSEAVFNNAADIENILTRVTGNQISNIDGLLRANGTANLFLLNPNGIVFGPNARLDIGGSFMASTAESLLFENGFEFSAIDPADAPLLAVTVPVGLQWNRDNPNAIALRGAGYPLDPNLIFPVPLFDPTFEPTGLQVSEGQTLALVGGNLQIDGGSAIAPGGHLELAAVRQGTVRFVPSSSGWSFDYSNAQILGNVRFIDLAFVDASGIGSASMQVYGENIDVRDGSLLAVQNRGNLDDGEVRLVAADTLSISGAVSEGARSSLQVSNIALGAGADVFVSAGHFILENGGEILSNSLSSAAGGNITVNVRETLEGSIDPANPLFGPSGLLTLNRFDGKAGDISVTASNLRLFGGNSIASLTYGTGVGGNITLNVVDRVEIAGVTPVIVVPSTIGSLSFIAGNSGNVTINTAQLVIRDGVVLNTNTFAAGNAGNLTVNASEFVEVRDSVSTTVVPSQISSSASIADEATGLFVRFPTGNAGQLAIHTPELRLSGEGFVGVNNEGAGNAGTLLVEADRVRLDSRSRIGASTRSGLGGNLEIRGNRVVLQNGSQITTEAGGIGNGGNLQLIADTLTLLNDSTVTADAFEGAGGNIQIETQGLYLSAESRITASSQLGVDGVVEVTEPALDTSAAVLTLTSEPVDPATQVVSVCTAAAEGNTFVVTGRGGLPEDPTHLRRGQTVWVDWQGVEISGDRAAATHDKGSVEMEESSADDGGSRDVMPLAEATSWQHRDNGTVELTAMPQMEVGDRWTPKDCVVMP